MMIANSPARQVGLGPSFRNESETQNEVLKVNSWRSHPMLPTNQNVRPKAYPKRAEAIAFVSAFYPVGWGKIVVKFCLALCSILYCATECKISAWLILGICGCRRERGRDIYRWKLRHLTQKLFPIRS
jgi:hypothetical protein